MSTSILKSKFDPRFCCEHQWASINMVNYTCCKCFATCTRDGEGQIELYSRFSSEDRNYRKEYRHG